MVELFRVLTIDWLGKRWLFIGLSTVLMIGGAASLLLKGSFEYGVDFKGGTIVSVKFTEKASADQVRQALQAEGAPNSQIQELQGGAVGEYGLLIDLGMETSGESDMSAGREIVTRALEKSYAKKFEILGSEFVGPKVGEDLRRQAVLATLYALGGILVYIAFRFEWIYGAAAVLAVFHDTLITLGFFSIFDKEINLTVVAALLTLVGYSVNDTIVVFDRVRENLRTKRRENFEKVLNDSINQTLSRTILTSGLTFLTVIALFLFGGEVINNFAFALVVGIIVGTYSSIAIASPMVLIYTQYRDRAGLQPVTAAVRAAKAK